MNKSDFLEMIESLQISKITYFKIEYENYEVNNKNNELSFTNN